MGIRCFCWAKVLNFQNLTSFLIILLGQIQFYQFVVKQVTNVFSLSNKAAKKYPPENRRALQLYAQ